MLRCETKTIKSGKGKSRQLIVIADSISELISETLKATDSHPRPHDDIGSESFIGREFSDIKEAAAAVTKPWDEGIKTVSEMMIEMRRSVKLPKPVSLKRVKVWSDEDGDEIDFDRLRSGDPFYRTTKKANAVKSKQLTLFIDIGAKARIDARKLMWRGIAAITIAKLLEDAGYRCEIWVYNSVTSGFDSGKGNAVMVNVKKMKDTLNIGLVTATVSSWFFRTIGFHAFNIHKGEVPTGGLGYHNEDVDELLDMIEPDADSRLDISGVWSKDAAAALIKTVIERMNAEAESKLAKA